MITVKAARIGSRVNEYAVEDDSTVADVLALAGISAEGFEIRVDGSRASLADGLDDGQTIIVSQKVKGNSAVISAC